MVILITHFEGTVSRVTPENREHAHLVGEMKSLRDFLNLPGTFGGAKIDCGSNSNGTHVARLLNIREQHLVVFVWIGKKLVMIDLKHERNQMGVLSSHGTQNTQG